ncbi:hypothetical protein [Formosa algae]|uniref:hypothetical protein n=1 Tax=Formosa algae TaxID=225843 RepID=UPI0011AF4ED6|nr:hypothetical protein [Formosa algae]
MNDSTKYKTTNRVINPMILSAIFKVAFKCVVTVLYMARSVQKGTIFSVKHNPNFLIFFYLIFSKSQIKKFGGLANKP